MNARLHRIEIRNYKAFREFKFEVEGRHLLIYGANGSGKSSLHWALHVFLESAWKEPKHHISKYFDPSKQEQLLNFFEQTESTPRPGEIAITFRDVTTGTETRFPISQTDHSTYHVPLIRDGNLASDFITYRFFFGFSDFKNSQSFNVWRLFEKEILPYCVSTRGANQSPFELWRTIQSGKANPTAIPGRGGANAYTDFNRRTAEFAAILTGIVDDISTAAQEFYDQHFSADDPAKVTLQLGLTKPPSSSGGNREDFTFEAPELEFGIKLGGQRMYRPQSFLDEAKMTQFALSVRFGATKVKLQTSDVKLLVLDDLLVSLDMSNRMKVVEILLSDTFADYQKIILTHDLGLFQEVCRRIGSGHSQWLFCKLTGDAKSSPKLTVSKSDLEIAQDYLANDQLTECGNRLRKFAESYLENFLMAANAKKGLRPLIDRGKFSSLSQKITEAKNLLALDAHNEFGKLLQMQFSAADLATFLSKDEIDATKFAALPADEKRKVIGKLTSARSDLQRLIIDLLSDASRKRLNAIKLLEDVEHIKDRILNPASHAGVTPIYTKEAEDAVKVIQALDAALTAALATL